MHVNEPVPSDVCDSLQSAVKALLVTDAPVSAGSLQEAIENESCFNNTAGLQRLAGRLCAVDECLRGLRIQRRFRNNCESLETDSARVAVLHKLSHSVSIAELKVPSGEDLPSSEARSDGADKKNDDDDDDDDDDEVPDTLWAACDECDKWRVVDPESHEALEAGGDDAKFHCGDVDKECEDRQLDDVEGAELFRDMIFKATGKKAKPQKKTSKKREGKKAATIRRRAARKYERIRELVSSSLALATKPGQGGISVNAVFEVSRHDEPKTMAAFDNLSAASLGLHRRASSCSCSQMLCWVGGVCESHEHFCCFVVWQVSSTLGNCCGSARAGLTLKAWRGCALACRHLRLLPSGWVSDFTKRHPGPWRTCLRNVDPTGSRSPRHLRASCSFVRSLLAVLLQCQANRNEIVHLRLCLDLGFTLLQLSP